jgi:hypothetical protein
VSLEGDESWQGGLASLLGKASRGPSVNARDGKRHANFFTLKPGSWDGKKGLKVAGKSHGLPFDAAVEREIRIGILHSDLGGVSVVRSSWFVIASRYRIASETAFGGCFFHKSASCYGMRQCLPGAMLVPN